jgi:hypothetical protein
MSEIAYKNGYKQGKQDAVVHARWNPIRNFGGGECYGYCTNCKTPVKADNATGLVMSNRFCHWCGAKMDGEKEETKTNSGISQRTVQALERMGQKVHGGEDA